MKIYKICGGAGNDGWVVDRQIGGSPFFNGSYGERDPQAVGWSNLFRSESGHISRLLTLRDQGSGCLVVENPNSGPEIRNRE